MYGEMYFYELDGTLKTMPINQFKAIHCKCVHSVEVIDGIDCEIQSVPSLIENYVFTECCGQKWFYNRFNAQVNLKERLENFREIARLRAKYDVKKSFRKYGKLLEVDMLLKEITDVQRGEIYI